MESWARPPREISGLVAPAGPAAFLTHLSDILGSEADYPPGTLPPAAARARYDKLLKNPVPALSDSHGEHLVCWAPSDPVVLGRLLQGIVKAIDGGFRQHVCLILALDMPPTCCQAEDILTFRGTQCWSRSCPSTGRAASS